MSFTKYIEPPNPANATDINNIYENQKYIFDKLIEQGVTPDTLSEILATPTMQYSSIADVYINLEKNLDKIGDNEYGSAYYGNSVTRGSYEPDRDEWQRWLNVLNDMYNILNGIVGKWQYLCCSDGYPIINNSKILLRGETI